MHRQPAVEGVLIKYARACEHNPMVPLCCVMLVSFTLYLAYVVLVYAAWLYLLPYSLLSWILGGGENLGACFGAGLHNWWAWLACFPFWLGAGLPVYALYRATTA